MKAVRIFAAMAIACVLSACSSSSGAGSVSRAGIVPDIPSGAQRIVRDTGSTPFDSDGEPYQEDGTPENYPNGRGGSTNGCGGRICPQAFVSTGCWYQAVVPGLHRPDTDIFLGCTGFDIPTGSYTPPHVAGGLAYGGAPQDGQTCSGSQPIGDYLGDFNSGNGPNPEYSTVVNAIVALKSAAIVSYSQGKYASNTVTIGWVYRDGEGHYWVQQNVTAAPDFSAGVSAFFASLAINFKNDSTIKYAGTTPPKMDLNRSYRDCWPRSPGTKFIG
jgi:hypothetical protein